MATPTKEQLLHWAEQFVALWNAGDKDAWVANWRAVAPGDFRMLDPVGTPEKHGFETCALEGWDLFQSAVRLHHHPGTVYVCANEVAWVMENHFTVHGTERMSMSVETYRFEPDGSVVIRNYYRLPEASDGEMAEIFETYQPTHQPGS